MTLEHLKTIQEKKGPLAPAPAPSYATDTTCHHVYVMFSQSER